MAEKYNFQQAPSIPSMAAAPHSAVQVAGDGVD
jgi:hypothetical protein